MKSLPTSLREILASPEVFKVGVGISEDRTKLLQDVSLDLASWVDLRHLVVNHWVGHHDKLGLQALAGLVLDVSLDKDWRIRASDWEADQLSARQVDYAANDALVGINIAWVVLSSLFTSSLSAWLSCLLWSGERLRTEVARVLQLYADLKFSNSSAKKALRVGKEKSPAPTLTGKLKETSVRKSPLYHNCMLEAPDGQLLCTSDVKKARWYISKGIGYQVNEDPFTVRLKFEPGGRPQGEAGEYYLSVKPNICVVCGRDQSFLRKSVVPHEYRKYFPAVMKDHQSHDVLLLCVSCHQQSNHHDTQLRRRLAAQCGAPVGSEADVKVRANLDMKRLRSAGRALQANRGKVPGIPERRREELLTVLREHYQTHTVDDQIIDMAADCPVNEENENYVPHSRAVVQHFLERGGLLELEVMWRQHFLETMKPRHLPPLWSVHHQADRLETKAADNRIDQAQYKLATQGVSQSHHLDLEAYRATKQPQLGVNPDIDCDNNNDNIDTDDMS